MSEKTTTAPRVAAIIVLFHPDPSLLERLLASVANQVKTIYLVDNTPTGQANNFTVPLPYQSQTSYVALGENQGIASAQNIGINQALAAAHTHVLLLDQDSALPYGMVQSLLETEKLLRSKGESVAAVGPVFQDEKTEEYSPVIRATYFLVRKISIDLSSKVPLESDHLISSGSLISAEALARIGLMKEELFIDWVDIEWGVRARSLGYRCFICPNIVMRHSIGDSAVQMLGKSINLHSDTRNYYIVRNAAFLLKSVYMGWRWRAAIAVKIPNYILFYSLSSNRRIRCFRLLIRGFLDGLSGRLGRMA